MSDNPKKRRESRDFSTQRYAKLRELQTILEQFKDQGITNTEIKRLLKKTTKKRHIQSKFKKQIPKLPLSIFQDSELSPFEIIIKYLRENHKLTFREIEELTNRKTSTLTSLYSKLPKTKKLHVDDSLGYIPLSIIKDRKLSVLESIVSYLKDQGMTSAKIASVLSKDRRTIWTVYNRAKTKLGGAQ